MRRLHHHSGSTPRAPSACWFIVAAASCGIVGSLYLANTLFIQTGPVFGVQWTAFVLFMVLVGGRGRFEGPILGAVTFYLIQANFGNSGAWHFIGLGAVAIAFALFLPQPLWGAIDRPPRLRLLPGRLHTTIAEGDCAGRAAAAADDG